MNKIHRVTHDKRVCRRVVNELFTIGCFLVFG